MSIETALVNAVQNLHVAGADFAVIASNTMHLLFERVCARSQIPLLSIIDATVAAIQRDQLNCVGLLGTRFTMECLFYRDALQRKDIRTVIPTERERTIIDAIIFDELARGVVKESSRSTYLSIIDQLIQQGAQGVILGCTEIPLLITPQHTSVQLYDTAKLHAHTALHTAVCT